MERLAVKSSALAAVGYDDSTQTLEVEFKAPEGREATVWRYFPVTRETYEAMLDESQSAGRILASIRNNSEIGGIRVEPSEATA